MRCFISSGKGSGKGYTTGSKVLEMIRSEPDSADILYTENSDYDEIERIGEKLSNAKVVPEDSELVSRICNAISELDFDVIEELMYVRNQEERR